jgi:hypothetical protein
MDRARWDLFLIKVGRHALYGPRDGVDVPTLYNADPTIAMAPPVAGKRAVSATIKAVRKAQCEAAAKAAAEAQAMRDLAKAREAIDRALDDPRGPK